MSHRRLLLLASLFFIVFSTIIASNEISVVINVLEYVKVPALFGIRLNETVRALNYTSVRVCEISTSGEINTSVVRVCECLNCTCISNHNIYNVLNISRCTSSVRLGELFSFFPGLIHYVYPPPETPTPSPTPTPPPPPPPGRLTIPVKLIYNVILFFLGGLVLARVGDKLLKLNPLNIQEIIHLFMILSTIPVIVYVSLQISTSLNDIVIEVW